MRLIPVLFCLFLLGACEDAPTKETSAVPVVEKKDAVTAEYDFSKPGIIRLKKKLNEISGIVYLGDNLLAAVQDESGIIFLLDYQSGEITKSIDFAGKGDYEDIAADENYFYVLESSGKIYRVDRKGEVLDGVYTLGGKKSREFESIHLESASGKIIMVCKECKHKDDLKEGYCFDLKTLEFKKQPCFSLDFTNTEKQLPDGTLLKPSATAINPADQKLYVLCSVGKTLLQCDRDGKIERAFPLDQKIFRQPEGLTFTPNGDMYISNEAAGKARRLLRSATGNNLPKKITPKVSEWDER